MKRKILLLVIPIVALFSLGCQSNKTRIAEGAGIGGAVGALAGGIIGYQSGHGVGGALIGGAIGAGSGAVVGSQINKPEQNVQAPSNSQLSVEKIVELTRQGVSSDEIINKIKNTNSKYSLTSEDIGYLRKQGVSQRVIEKMQGI